MIAVGANTEQESYTTQIWYEPVRHSDFEPPSVSARRAALPYFENPNLYNVSLSFHDERQQGLQYLRRESDQYAGRMTIKSNRRIMNVCLLVGLFEAVRVML